MDRANRELVFCHQCENEWYRDEHGLVCPECTSEFTEVVSLFPDPCLAFYLIAPHSAQYFHLMLSTD